MATYISNLTNGQIDEKGFLRLFGTILSASGVIQSGSMAVAAQSTPDMTVKVAGGAIGHDVVFITTAGDTYHGWNTTDVNVTITANSSGVIKTDAIVAYVDLAAGIATSNNPSALKFVAVRRSGVLTGNPTGSDITGTPAIGSNPYLVLAYVTVANGASSINSGNISDQRVRAVFATNTVPTAAIQERAVTTAKWVGSKEVHYPLLGRDENRTNTAYSLVDQSRTNIDFARILDGATEAYLRFTAYPGGGANSVSVKINNLTNGTDITGSETTLAGGTAEGSSGNILANLPTTSKQMALYFKCSAAATYIVFKASLVVRYT